MFLFILSVYQVQSQCTGCTSTVTSNTSISVTSGSVVCLSYTGAYNSNITVTGGTLCVGSGVSWNGGNMNVNGTPFVINNYGTISFNLTVPSGMTINNYGSITGSVSQNGGTIINYSGALFDPSSVNMNSGIFTNEAGASAIIPSVNFSSGFTFTNYGSAVFTGTLTVNSGATVTLDGTRQYIAGSVMVDGTLSMTGTDTIGGAFTANSDAVVNFTGTNTIDGSVTNNSTINVSGTFSIGGSYSDNSGASIKAVSGCSNVNLAGSYSNSGGTFNGNNYGLPVYPPITCNSCLINGAGNTSPPAPTTQPNTLSLTMYGSGINGSFIAPSVLTNIEGYIVLRYIGTSAPTDNPVNNTSYSAGSTVGSSTVAAIIIDATSGTKTFYDALPTGNCGKNVYYRIFSFNGCKALITFDVTSPLTGNTPYTPKYTWNQTTASSYATAANWTPTRTTPQTCDILYINNGGSPILNSVPATQTIGQLFVQSNTTAYLQPAGASSVLTFSGTNSTTGLTIDVGSTLDADSSIQLAFAITGMSAAINGQYNTSDPQGLSGATNTAFSSTNSPTLSFGSTSTICYNANSGTQNVTSRSDYRNLTFSGAGTKNLAGNVTTTGTGNTITITAGSVDVNGYTLTEASPTNLTMTGGTLRMNNLNVTLPQLTGTYSISSGTVELYGAGSQILRGAETYYNLLFSGGGTNTLSAAISTGTNEINGTVTISNSDTLDVASYNFGSPVTNFTMTSGGFKTSNTSATVPMMAGTYNLTGGSVILYGTTCSDSQSVRSGVTYFNLVINATSANLYTGNVTQKSGVITIAASGTLTVNSPAVFTIEGTSTVAGAGTFQMGNGASLFYGSSGLTAASCGTGSSCGNVITTNRTYLTGTQGYLWPY